MDVQEQCTVSREMNAFSGNRQLCRSGVPMDLAGAQHELQSLDVLPRVVVSEIFRIRKTSKIYGKRSCKIHIQNELASGVEA
jgi:hypothetical protein